MTIHHDQVGFMPGIKISINVIHHISRLESKS